MSTIVKYSSGSTYTIVPNKVDIEKIQDLDGQYHIPNTSIIGMMRLGLGVQRITVSGDALDMSACLWHDVVAISFDSGVSYQTVYFSGVPYTSDCWSGIYPYALSLLASPLKEQTATRYPTTGYKFGNQSITGISQAGNVNAFPTIHYLAPLFYAPLSNTLIDFAGQAVTFTRSASKVHGGVTYPINTPIFDNGLYLASDTAQDVAKWTPPASTLRTVAMQIKSRYPGPWVIGAGAGTANLLTANQSNAETNTTGMAGSTGTFTRNTVNPVAGAADFKLVVTGGTNAEIYTDPTMAVTANRWYVFHAQVKTSGCAAGRKVNIRIAWFTAANAFISTSDSAEIDAPTTATTMFVTDIAPPTAAKAYVSVRIISVAVGEILYADSLMLEYVPVIHTVWTAALNNLTIDTVESLIKWTDGTTTVSSSFPIWAYLNGQVEEIVLLENAAHAVTVMVIDWYTGTGTLANLTWPQLTLGNLEGSIANLIQYPYVLTSAEYQALAYSSLSLIYASNVSGSWHDAIYVGNKYAGEVVKGSDKRLVNANGSDISALLGGTDIAIGASAVTIAQTQGLSARWYVEVKRTDV